MNYSNIQNSNQRRFDAVMKRECIIVSDYYDQKVKLFQLDDFKELKVLNNNVYGVSNDTVYIYNNKIGLKKAIVNRELIYNYKNIYDVYES